jgi:predicted nucleotidyltransferase
MRERSSNFAGVRFLDLDAVLESLRGSAQAAKVRQPEIVQVLLFGSLTTGNWTADSDADLIVVVRREFGNLLERSEYQIHSALIPTDTLVYTEAEFDSLAQQPGSLVAQALETAIEL